jgi:hypothetical protein
MTDNPQNAAIMAAGLDILFERLGAIETEIFITTIQRNNLDYTEWRQKNLWPEKPFGKIHAEASRRERNYQIPQGVTIL